MNRHIQVWRGFTLVEVLVVIAIIGVLTAIAIPVYLHQRERAKDAAVKEGVHAICLGVQSWATEHDDTYPAAPAVAHDGAVGALVEKWPTDPWNSGVQMGNLGTRGNFAYVLDPDGDAAHDDFLLQGFGSAGTPVIELP